MGQFIADMLKRRDGRTLEREWELFVSVASSGDQSVTIAANSDLSLLAAVLARQRWPQVGKLLALQ